MYFSASLSGSLLVAAPRIERRFDTPGLVSKSKLTSLLESVTARLNFFAIEVGSSNIPIVPFADSEDLDILFLGSCRSITRAATFGIAADGMISVSPYLELKRSAMSRVSSKCWRWSSPTGTRSAS